MQDISRSLISVLVVAIVGLVVFVLLNFVSGVPMLERRSDKKWGGQPDYEAYKAKTPVLLLRPPR